MLLMFDRSVLNLEQGNGKDLQTRYEKKKKKQFQRSFKDIHHNLGTSRYLI